MSTKLTLSAALSVLMMAGYVLFGTSAAQDFAAPGGASAMQVSEAGQPSHGGWVLPGLR